MPVTLNHYAAAGRTHIELWCEKCPRTGRYSVARAIAKHGADLGLPYFLEAVSADCPRRALPHYHDRCGVVFRDPSGQ